MKIVNIRTKKFSWYKTDHEFANVIDIKSAEDYYEAIKYAQSKNLMCYTLGNGSNTYFRKKKISTVILRNCLPDFIRPAGEDLFEVSSSTNVPKLLRYLYSEGREGPFNLASVPATVGGAVAMNAGGGKTEGLFISRYLKSVSYLCNGERIEANVSELEMGFRKSLFSERRDCIIISATFRFPKTEFISNPVTERLDWAREHQDLKIPNCGSVWRAFSFPLLRLAENLFRRSPAYFSKKSLIWISNKSTDHRHILRILRVVSLLHLVAFRKCEHEIRIVD